MTANDTATDEAAYLQVIQGKTAELFAAACKVGAEIAQRSDAEATALYDYGNALGIAFQLVDDYLDYSANEADLGKTVGDDFREGKITLPIILALAAAKDQGLEDETAFWVRTMEKLEQTEDDLAQAMTLMEKHGTLEATRDRARLYGEQAVAALETLPDNAYRDALAGIVGFCIERAY
jgi:octaprenyl-diphosphate synthase